MKLHTIPTLLLVLSFFCNNSYAQTIPASRLADWSKAGYGDTLPVYSTQVNIMNHGGVADGVTPNDNAFATAVAALNNAPGTIFFPAGNYLFNQTMLITRDSIIIKGEGNSTRLLFDLGNTNAETIHFSGSVVIPAASVKSTLNKNDTSLVIHNGSNYKPGNFIQLWGNDSNVIFSSWALKSASQILQIKSVTVDTIVFDNALRRTYPPTYDPFIRVFNEVKGAGIECLYIERKDSTAQQTNNIAFERSAYCWVTGVESNKANFAHVAISNSTHILVRGNYFHHAHKYGEGGQGYGALIQYTSGDCLVENNIFEHLRHSMLVQAGANGNVFAYNYSTDPYWTQPPFPTNSAGDIVCHGNYPYLNLFEGNIVQNIVVDDSHGINGPYNTFFRNRAETYGIFTVANVSDSMNYAGNEITNTLGYYQLTGVGNFASGNNVKGVINPAGTANLPESSLYLKSPPGYWQGNNPYPNIGTPYAYNQGINAAKQRYSSQKTDCVRNPKYTGIHSLQNKKLDVAVSPNPFNNRLQILLNEKAEGTEYKLYNVSGHTILTGQTTEIITSIDATNIPVGVYILEVKNKDGVSTREKLVKIDSF